MINFQKTLEVYCGLKLNKTKVYIVPSILYQLRKQDHMLLSKFIFFPTYILITNNLMYINKDKRIISNLCFSHFTKKALPSSQFAPMRLVQN